MTEKQHGNWVIDLENLTCRNKENNLLIVFEKKGRTLHGRIRTMPMRLAQNWVNDPDCRQHIRNAFIEADEVFFREYFAQPRPSA